VLLSNSLHAAFCQQPMRKQFDLILIHSLTCLQGHSLRRSRSGPPTHKHAAVAE
jgi:hypothetical protein